MTRETRANAAIGATLLLAIIGHGAFLQGSVTAVRADVAELREEVRADVAELRTEVRADVAELRDDMTALRADVTELRERMARIEGAVDILTAFLADQERARKEG